MYGICNLLSLILGIFSWALGIAALWRRNRKICAGSFCACAVALLLQIFYTQHLVAIRDWSAIEDTHGAVAMAAAVLLAGTVLLNFPVLVKEK